MQNSNETFAGLQRASLRRAKVVYLSAVALGCIVASVIPIAFDGLKNFALVKAAMWSSMAFSLCGFGLCLWRKSLDFEVRDPLIRIAEQASLALLIGLLSVFLLIVISMGFAADAHVVVPILAGSLAVGILGSGLLRLLPSHWTNNVVKFLFSFVGGGVLAFVLFLAAQLCTLELRGEVTQYVDVFCVHREHDLQVDLFVAAVSLLPGIGAFIVAHFSTRRLLHVGLGTGALAVGVLMPSVTLLG